MPKRDRITKNKERERETKETIGVESEKKEMSLKGASKSICNLRDSKIYVLA